MFCKKNELNSHFTEKLKLKTYHIPIEYDNYGDKIDDTADK